MAVRTARSLDEGMELVVSLPVNTVDPANDGKLVHISGPVEDVPLLVDEDMGVAVRAVALERDVEMYQWHESEHTTEHKTFSGSIERRTSYSYSQRWSSHVEVRGRAGWERSLARSR